MALVNIPSENLKITDGESIAGYLAKCGIDYEQRVPKRPIADGASSIEILNIYASDIEALKARGGYVTADVIDVGPETPGLESMLMKFNREHWHDEDEVRLIVAGRGLFHIHPKDQPVVAIEVEAGDLIRIPRGVLHWFDLCADRRIRAIRLFQDVAGWTPHYTDSSIDGKYLAVCFGHPHLLPLAGATG